MLRSLQAFFQKIQETESFPLDKTLRFIGRFVQMALALFTCVFLWTQNIPMIDKYHLQDLKNAMVY
jgi:hypothetical protein